MNGFSFTSNSLRVCCVVLLATCATACSTVSAVRPVEAKAVSYERVEYKVNLAVPMTPINFSFGVERTRESN